MKIELEANRKIYTAEGKDPVEAIDNLGLTVFDVKTKAVVRFIQDKKVFEQFYPLHKFRNLLRPGSVLRNGLPLVLSKYFNLK